MYLYLKAIHIIFVVTWFAGIFYLPRLFIYNIEAQEKASVEAKNALTQQFSIMMKRLWFGITIPSAIITLILGVWLMIDLGWWRYLADSNFMWLVIKLCLVIALYAYNYTLHVVLMQQTKGIFRYTSMQMRLWNEVATILLVAIVFLVTVKNAMSLVYGTIGILLFIVLLVLAIRIYKILREQK